jgi:Family of unknown function (DUF5678)
VKTTGDAITFNTSLVEEEDFREGTVTFGGSTGKTVTYSGASGSVLDAFDAASIEWYVSEVGDLYIRTWQHAIQGFTSGADTERVRNRQSARGTAEVSNLDWYTSHLEELRAEYPGEWVAIVDHDVVAHHSTFAGLLEVSRQLDARPFVVQVPAELRTRKMTFGQQGL